MNAALFCSRVLVVVDLRCVREVNGFGGAVGVCDGVVGGDEVSQEGVLVPVLPFGAAVDRLPVVDPALDVVPEFRAPAGGLKCSVPVQHS